ncbi:hypothetical protein [Pseudonocardia spirodelae]|uniref:Uncharacterized protein n=1 Tax=Pseudonocardia spirodelae TaxID=3133431 RepID=A0ABU8TAY2_9PSEU
MDQARLRLAALAAPVALGAVLGVAAALEPDGVHLPSGAAPVTARATTASLTGFPHTTPPPTPVQARPGVVPMPVPSAAGTAEAR